MYTILVLHGPNLNLLGQRDPSIYGADTLEDINAYIINSHRNDTFDFFQSNHEGAIIDKIHQAMAAYDAIIINPGAYAHYSYAIRDAIEACPIPVIEVHLSNIAAREKFRQTSVTAEVCVQVISGFGKESYIRAVEFLRKRLGPEKD